MKSVCAYVPHGVTVFRVHNLIPNSLKFRINMLPAGTGPEAAAEGSYYMFTEAGLLSPIRAHDTVL